MYAFFFRSKVVAKIVLKHARFVLRKITLTYSFLSVEAAKKAQACNNAWLAVASLFCGIKEGSERSGGVEEKADFLFKSIV